MLLVKPKIGRSTKLIDNCSVCGIRLLIVEMKVDLDVESLTYYCPTCVEKIIEARKGDRQ